MCGLSVALDRDPSVAERMCRRMKHRGTREPAAVSVGPWSISHIRLPVNGLSPRYDQPITYGGVTTAFVGEIVNFREIDPRVKSDVAVVAEGIADKGLSVVRKWDGFWAIASVDHSKKDELHLVTDFLAKKPLYARFDEFGKFIGAASEIKALAELGPLFPDPAYFSSVRKWGYHSGTKTWARGVRKIPPGSHVTVTAHEPGWTIDEAFDPIEPDHRIHLATAIVEAVEQRVESSDIPVALLLSGGLDSSIIYQLARGNRDLTLYHVPNGEDGFLDALAPEDQVNMIEFKGNCIKQVLRANEGPVDLGSMLQQYALGQAVREHVCLSGDGADEAFGGYRRAAEYDSQGSDVWEELVYYHLPRLDKMMMAGTVELRCPFLARKVLAGALALPYDARIDKRWLRNAFGDILPPAIRQAPKRALKSPQVLKDPLLWRIQLIDAFQKMIEKGEAV